MTTPVHEHGNPHDPGCGRCKLLAESAASAALVDAHRCANCGTPRPANMLAGDVCFDADRCAVRKLRNTWTRGTRVKLTAHSTSGLVNYLNRIPVGTAGTVRLVDTLGTIHVDWDGHRPCGVDLSDGDEIMRLGD